MLKNWKNSGLNFMDAKKQLLDVLKDNDSVEMDSLLNQLKGKNKNWNSDTLGLVVKILKVQGEVNSSSGKVWAL